MPRPPPKRQMLSPFLRQPGFSFKGVKFNKSSQRRLMHVFDRAGVPRDQLRQRIERRVLKLLNTMIEEFVNYDDDVNILHLNYQDRFFDAVTPNVLWTQSVSRGDICNLIHFLIEGRRMFFSHPLYSDEPDTPVAIATQSFMNLYQQRERTEAMRATQGVLQKSGSAQATLSRETLPEGDKHKDDKKSASTASEKALPIRLKEDKPIPPPKKETLTLRSKQQYERNVAVQRQRRLPNHPRQQRIVSAPDHKPFLVTQWHYGSIVDRERKKKIEKLKMERMKRDKEKMEKMEVEEMEKMEKMEKMEEMEKEKEKWKGNMGK